MSIAVAAIRLIPRYGIVLPSMISNGRRGDTMSCSIVPLSFSRTTVRDVDMTAVRTMMNPISPGTRNFDEIRSGLYQMRGWKSIGTGSERPLNANASATIFVA